MKDEFFTDDNNLWQGYGQLYYLSGAPHFKGFFINSLFVGYAEIYSYTKIQISFFI